MIALRAIIQATELADNMRRNIMLGITWKGPRAMGVGTLQTDDGGFQLPSTMKETMEENQRIASPVPLTNINNNNKEVDGNKKDKQKKSTPTSPLSQQQKGLETRLTTLKPENYSFKKELINMITGEKTMFEVTSDNKLILLNDKAINDDRLKNITFSIDLPDDKTRFKFQVKEQTDKIVLVSLFNKLMLNFDDFL